MNDWGVGGEQWQHLVSTWEHAVESQMLSDVPVGVFLSGGTDSSAIVATLRRLGHSPKTFSVSFAEQDFDESRYSECVARQFGTEHQAIAVSPNDVLGQFEKMLDAYDQPSIDGINIYTIAQAVHHAGIKVAISGLGGDEGFAGYPSFRRIARLDQWFRRLPRGLAGIGAAALALTKPRGKLARLTGLLRNARSRLDVYCILRLLFSATVRSELLAEGIPCGRGLDVDLMRELSRQADAMDVVNAVSMLEMRLYMQNMLLRDTDQMAMAHGLEVRVPLLDHKLVEEVARIPGALKLPRAGQPNKWLLVRLAGESLPHGVVYRRKMGFVFPWETWLRRELRSHVEEVLMDRTAMERTGLRATAVASFWRRYLSGERGLRSSEVLALVQLARWATTNQLTAPYQSN
jgi:asparagine synthase (glutamine-hydrolysing)